MHRLSRRPDWVARRASTRRAIAATIAALGCTVAIALPAWAQEEEEEGGPTPSVEVATTSGTPPATTTPPGTTLPAGCVAPDPPDAVFEGPLTRIGPMDSDADAPTLARFEVVEVLEGSLDAFAGREDATAAGAATSPVTSAVSAVAGSVVRLGTGVFVDVDFGRDVRHLDLGTSYRVAAAIDPATGRLASKTRVRPSLFGENQVVGIEDDPNCPVFVDPIITILATGAPVETGLLHPLTSNRGGILRSFGRPALVVLAIIVALVLAKRFLVGTVRFIIDDFIRGRERHRRTLEELDRSPTGGAAPRPPTSNQEPAAR